jgi:hypothetical protein
MRSIKKLSFTHKPRSSSVPQLIDVEIFEHAAQALAALMADDVSASQQSCCSFDGTAFLIRALG